jgi:hypothetical protein
MAKIWPWIAVVAFISIAAGIAQTGHGRSILQAAGLAPPSGSYTALSFANPQALPTRLESKAALLQVSFVIQNASDSPSPEVYHWVILLSHGRRSHAAAAGQVTVRSGARTTVNKTVRGSCAGGQLQLTVHLARPAESIDFWTTCWSRKRKIR